MRADIFTKGFTIAEKWDPVRLLVNVYDPKWWWSLDDPPLGTGGASDDSAAAPDTVLTDDRGPTDEYIIPWHDVGRTFSVPTGGAAALEGAIRALDWPVSRRPAVSFPAFPFMAVCTACALLRLLRVVCRSKSPGILLPLVAIC